MSYRLTEKHLPPQMHHYQLHQLPPKRSSALRDTPANEADKSRCQPTHQRRLLSAVLATGHTHAQHGGAAVGHDGLRREGV